MKELIKENSKKKIQSIQILRALASIMVVICHTSITNRGGFGVDIFFVISGFIIVYTTEKADTPYWLPKVKKIIPLYWFMTLLTSLIILIAPNLFHSYEVNREYFIKSLLFIPYSHNGINQPVLGLGWTLNYELFFYFIFWCAMKIQYSHRVFITSLVLLYLMVLSNILEFDNYYVQYYGNNIIVEFVYGMIAYYIYVNIIKKYVIQISDVRIWFLVTGILFYMMWEFNDIYQYRGFIEGILALVLFCFSLAFECSQTRWEVLLVKIGNASYILYLVHIYIVRAVEMIFNKWLPNIMSSVVAVVLSVFIAVKMNDILQFIRKAKDKM